MKNLFIAAACIAVVGCAPQEEKPPEFLLVEVNHDLDLNMAMRDAGIKNVVSMPFVDVAGPKTGTETVALAIVPWKKYRRGGYADRFDLRPATANEAIAHGRRYPGTLSRRGRVCAPGTRVANEKGRFFAVTRFERNGALMGNCNWAVLASRAVPR